MQLQWAVFPHGPALMALPSMVRVQWQVSIRDLMLGGICSVRTVSHPTTTLHLSPEAPL